MIRATQETSSPAPPEVARPSAEVKQYQRLKLIARIGSLIVSLAFLLVTALLLGPRIDRVLRHVTGDNRWVSLVGLAIFYGLGLELVSLPFDFWSGFILEHRYGLSNQTLPRWIWKQVKGYLIGGPFGLLLLLALYALLWFSGPWWWLWAAAGWLVLTLILGQLLPVVVLPLFYKVTRIEDGSLLETLRRMAQGTGLKVEGIYRLHLSAETRKANAALAGLGRTRRVLLGDTLLDNFSPEEIEVVFAHEVGHHVYRHLVKMVIWGVVLAGAGFWICDLVLQHVSHALGYTAFNDPAALPLLILVLTLFGLVLSPAQNALSRYFERQCDRYALERTRNPDAYRSAFEKLARMNKADLEPHPVVVWLFDDHPPIRQRLAMADAFIGPPADGPPSH